MASIDRTGIPQEEILFNQKSRIMKKTLLSLMFAGILVSSLNAAVITISNDPKAPAQYSSIGTAITNANPGDTLMVYGSTSSYGTVTVNKQIVLIGAGYHNPYGDVPYADNSLIGTLYLDGVGAFAASNSIISGFSISNLYYRGNGTSSKIIEGVIIERCQLHYIRFDDGGVTYRNDTVRNCLISGSYTYTYNMTYEGVLFHNNIYNAHYFYGYSTNTDLSGIKVRNCLFLNRPSSNLFDNTKGLTLENNIFYATEPQGCTDCAFNNNLTYANTNNVLTGASSANPGSVGSGNLENVNPEFATYPPEGGAFSYDYDFTVEAAAALTAGTDGKVLGTGGGLLPYIPGENPSIPQMTEVTFPDDASSVKVGGTLDVTFKAKKQD